MTRARSQKLKLMVVDDEPDNLDLLYRTFRREFQVFRAESGAKALQTLDEIGEVAVIISDQRMPGMSGTEFLSRTVDRFPDTMRIVLTGYTDVADLVEAINAGQVFKYITKPWEPETLKTVVAQAAETYEAISRRTRELSRALQRESLFNEIVSAIRESLDYQGMLQTIVATIGNNLGADLGLLYAHDENQGLVSPPFCFPANATDPPFPLPNPQVLQTLTPTDAAPTLAAEGAASPTLTQGLEQLLAYLCQHPKQRSCELRETAEGHIIGLPLTYKKQLLAVLVLYCSGENPLWGEDDMQLLENVAEQSAIAVSQAKLYQWTQEQSEKLQAELDVARQIQANLLRQDLPTLEGIRIQACCQPARAVGGDFFEVYAHPQGDVWLAVGDVSGKGVPAALYMASTLSLLRRELTQEVSPEPETVIRNLNRSLLQDLVNNNCFITAVLLRYRPQDGSLAYANAGHIYPIVWNPSQVAHQTQTDPQYLTTRGIPLGILEEWRGQAGVGSLAQGEVLLLASDGITEASVGPVADQKPGTAALMLQQAGLWQLLTQYSHSPVLEELLGFIQSHSQTQDDDQTLVSLEIV